MKSVNQKKDQGCTPISSNCVIWQGPCVDCLSIDTGDTVSDVIAELATVLCELKGNLDLSDLDLTCLLEDCTSCSSDKNITNILSLLINKVCSIVIPEPEPEPEEISVTIAACFQVLDLNGDLVTSMTVSDYAKAIGIKLCGLKTLVDQHTTTIANHETRITVLENANYDVVLPQVTPNCVLPSVATDMDLVLEALEEQFCALRTVTGLPTALSQAVAKQCSGLNSAAALSQSGTMSSISGWKTTVATVADSLNNMWITICDMRTALAAVQNCCGATCDDLIVNYLPTIVDNGATIKIYFSGYTSIPSGFTSCISTGSVMNISDGIGGSYNLNVVIPTAAANAAPISINVSDTPLSNSGTFTFTLASCLTDGTLTCNKTVVKTAAVPQSSCAIPTNVTATINPA